jgi:hypothetical protein
MAASTGDKFTDTYNSANPNVARVTSSRTAGVTTLACDNLAGWPTVSKVHFSTYQINSSGAVVANTQIDWYGIVSSNNITNLTRLAGVTDTGSSIGDVVEMMPTGSWAHDLYDGLTVEHSRAGAHTATAAATIAPLFASGAIPTAKLADDAGITNAKIATAGLYASKLYNPYKFSAYSTTNTALTINTWTKVVLDNELFDTGNNFDSTTNYRFTAPVAGFYQLSAQVGIGSAGLTSLKAGGGALYKNGSVLAYGAQTIGSSDGAGLPRSQINILIQLAATDYIELYAVCTEAGRSIDGSSSATYFTGFLVSAT